MRIVDSITNTGPNRYRAITIPLGDQGRRYLDFYLAEEALEALPLEDWAEHLLWEQAQRLCPFTQRNEI